MGCFQVGISHWPLLFMGLLIPSPARRFKATAVRWWLPYQEAPPVPGIVLYLHNRSTYKEHPSTAACYYSLHSYSTAPGT